MLLMVGRLAYKNYQLNLEEARLNSDISSLENEIQDLRNKIVYFQSDSYKEKMIRAKLNLQKEGEEVVVITPSPVAEEVSEEEVDLPKNNPQKWLWYFFGRI
jgi:cell division protein FtsB